MTNTDVSPVNVDSSNASSLIYITTGVSPVTVGSSSLSYILANLEGYAGEPYDILIPVLLTGTIDPIFPPPTPPVDFAGLVDPTVAPTLFKSDTADGHLPAGTYRYSYAAWKGTPAQATAPSPTASITLAVEDTVTLTYPTIEGADGYLVYREDL